MKRPTLSPELEHAVLYAISRGACGSDVVTPEELSKPGRAIHQAITSLISDGKNPPFSPTSIGLVAVDVLGQPREVIRGYLIAMETSVAGAEVGDILNKVRAKQTLVELITEAGSMLSRGNLDIGLLNGVLTRDAGVSDLKSLADEWANGFPDPPKGIPISSMPLVTEATGGLFGMWSISGEPGVGKALALDTAIPTPLGWTTMGQLSIGDVIFSDLGKPCNVTYVTPIQRDRECYQVKFSDGEELTADKDHMWFIKYRTGHRLTSTVTTENLLERGRVYVPRPKPLELPEIDLPIPPYVLGLWLGDGHSTTAAITSGTDDATELQRNIEACEIPVISRRRGTVMELSLTNGERTSQSRGRSVQHFLGELGVLKNKHIPQQYLRSSVSQRKELLKGLMDSDGHIARRNSCEFTTTNQRLSQGMIELLRSLGYIATIQEGQATLYGRVIGPKWRVHFLGLHNDPPARLNRKVARLVPATKKPYWGKSVIAVIPIASVPVRCIQVDSPSSLYLAGKAFTVTHNTGITWQIALDVARKIPVIYVDRENGIAVLADRTRQMVNGDLSRARALTSRVYYRNNIRNLDADLALVPPPAVVVVDSVQKLPSSVTHRRESIDKWVHRLESLKTRGYHIILVSEVPRSQYNQDAYIGAYKESGEIEYSADTGIQLLPQRGSATVELHIVKNRHRPTHGYVTALERVNSWGFKELGGPA